MASSDTDPFDLRMSRRALELAAAGIGLVSPNPLVGCVIVSKEGEVVGEATYRYDEITHAEVLALEKAGDRARGGTAFVSLEPHDHHGKTPPCTEALINAGIRRVVAPIEDPNPEVSGRGFRRLREKGIEVVTGILAEEATRSNEKFICWHLNKRPFIHLKLAASLDGRISLNHSVSTRLSGVKARMRAHELRHEYDAIMVGANTAVVDDPSLTDRSGKKRHRPLVRIILDNRLRLPSNSKLAKTARDTPVLVFTSSADTEKIADLESYGVEIVRSDDGSRNIAAVLEEFYRREIQSVLVEGGTEVAGAFCDAAMVDKVTFLFAPLVIGGEAAPVAIGGCGATELRSAMRLNGVEVTRLDDDIEVTGYPER